MPLKYPGKEPAFVGVRIKNGEKEMIRVFKNLKNGFK